MAKQVSALTAKKVKNWKNQNRGKEKNMVGDYTPDFQPTKQKHWSYDAGESKNNLDLEPRILQTYAYANGFDFSWQK